MLLACATPPKFSFALEQIVETPCAIATDFGTEETL